MIVWQDKREGCVESSCDEKMSCAGLEVDDAYHMSIGLANAQTIISDRRQATGSREGVTNKVLREQSEGQSMWICLGGYRTGITRAAVKGKRYVHG